MTNTPVKQASGGLDPFEIPWIGFDKVHAELRFIEGAAATQDGDKALKALLSKVLQGNPNKRLQRPPPLDHMETLNIGFPHFAPVIDCVLGELALQQSPGALPRRMPPMLVTGDPGIGKTRFARELAQRLGVPVHVLGMSSSTSGFALGGLDRGWATGRQGEVFNALMRGEHLNPVMVLDEIDKTNSDTKSDPLGPLYQLLEADTARVFEDEFVRVPVDASFITWVATANSTQAIPEALLSRMRVFEIAKPTSAQMVSVVESQYKALRSEVPALTPNLAPAVVARLCRHTPRQAAQALQTAAGLAARRAGPLPVNRLELLAEDVRMSNGAQRTLGFV